MFQDEEKKYYGFTDYEFPVYCPRNGIWTLLSTVLLLEILQLFLYYFWHCRWVFQGVSWWWFPLLAFLSCVCFVVLCFVVFQFLFPSSLLLNSSQLQWESFPVTILLNFLFSSLTHLSWCCGNHPYIKFSSFLDVVDIILYVIPCDYSSQFLIFFFNTSFLVLWKSSLYQIFFFSWCCWYHSLCRSFLFCF